MLLRRNHDVKKRSQFGFGLRIIFFIGLLILILFLLLKNQKSIFSYFQTEKIQSVDEIDVLERTYLPQHKGQILHKKYFSLSYIHHLKTAEWVAYRLTKEDLRERTSQQRKLFESDADLEDGSTAYYDYSGSGYERGHLVPAADMSFDSIGLHQTYLLSNIIPQKRGCNNGIWKELEIQVRDWVYKYGDVYIISGPVYNQPKQIKRIKKSNIAIPDQFFKIVLVYNDTYKGAIGFLIPNETSYKHLHTYTMDVNRLEEITDINFFHFMFDENEEERLESAMDLSKFHVNEKRFQQRLRIWNHE